jgi:hypothetical protein
MATPVSRAVKLSMALFLSLGHSEPSSAQYADSYERKSRKSIESDIRNGAPADDICRNSRIPASISKDPSFKDWAYGIAKKYCPPDKMGKPSNEGIEPQETKQPECRMMSGADAEKARKGGYVNLSRGGCVMIFNPLR